MALTLWAQLLEAALQLRFLCQFLGGRALPVRSGEVSGPLPCSPASGLVLDSSLALPGPPAP